MFSAALGQYQMLCDSKRLPTIYDHYKKHAQLVEEIELAADGSAVCFVAIGHAQDWPFLVVAQSYAPADNGFYPGVALVPETALAFIGAGTRLLAYRLHTPHKLWEATAAGGFWHWGRHKDYIVMAAELELAAWNLHGQKLWSTFVEPPWEYTVVAGQVHLDVMGQKRTFSLIQGPQ